MVHVESSKLKRAYTSGGGGGGVLHPNSGTMLNTNLYPMGSKTCEKGGPKDIKLVFGKF